MNGCAHYECKYAQLLVTEWTTTAARPHEIRRRLEAYPVVDAVQARYGDMDANGHLNNLALESMHENARDHEQGAVSGRV